MCDTKDFKLTAAALGAMLNADLENATVASTPGGIEAQEAQGQKDFVASETLPTKCPRKELEELGFVFGEAADDIFTYVQFPEGWTKSPTDHSMWSDLVDDKGRRRGGIFYKAAFYDRSAHMNLDSRIRYSRDYDNDEVFQYKVYRDGEVIHETEAVQPEGWTSGNRYNDAYWAAEDKASKEVNTWLEENYPDWENPMAYWD